MSFHIICHPDGTSDQYYANRGNAYSTPDEVVEYEIIPALGDHAADYDIQAIGDAMIGMALEFNDAGTRIGNVEYFLDIPDADAFWEIAQRHDRS